MPISTRTTPAALAALAAVTLAAATAGCGGSGPSSSTHAGSSQDPTRAAFKYAACMRAHGLTSFPDPQVTGQGAEQSVHITAIGSKSSPQFQAAAKACHTILPALKGGARESAQQQRTRVADALSFARCVRSHGVARFPDPTAHGDLSVAMVQAQGIDVHSPAVLRVVQACLPASHGALTPAKVKRALDEAGG